MAEEDHLESGQEPALLKGLALLGNGACPQRQTCQSGSAEGLLQKTRYLLESRGSWSICHLQPQEPCKDMNMIQNSFPVGCFVAEDKVELAAMRSVCPRYVTSGSQLRGQLIVQQFFICTCVPDSIPPSTGVT